VPEEPAWTVYFLDRDGEIAFQVSPTMSSAVEAGSAGRDAQALLQAFRALDSVCRLETAAKDWPAVPPVNGSSG
jgi:hypothetical protein